MTPAVWLSVASLCGTLLVALALRAFATGRWANSQEEAIKMLAAKLAGLTSQAQLIEAMTLAETKLREIFVTRELIESHREFTAREREYLKDDIERVRDDVKVLTLAVHKDLSDLRGDVAHLRRELHDQRR